MRRCGAGARNAVRFLPIAYATDGHGLGRAALGPRCSGARHGITPGLGLLLVGPTLSFHALGRQFCNADCRFCIVLAGPFIPLSAARSAAAILLDGLHFAGTAGRKQMPEGGSSIFTDADGYQAHMQDILDLVVLQPREFHARLTWADLPNLRLLRAREGSARVGFMTLPADRVFVTFPARSDSALLYGSVGLQFGDLMLHSRGERLHQRTTAACEWASISIAPAALSAFGRSLSERHLVAPAAMEVVRPCRADGRRLERLHARICRVVERNLASLSNREVVRGLEQDLISALISCLAYGKVQKDRSRSDHRITVLSVFEDLLAIQPHKLLRSREVCGALGISEATLRAACMRTLGMKSWAISAASPPEADTSRAGASQILPQGAHRRHDSPLWLFASSSFCYGILASLR